MRVIFWYMDSFEYKPAIKNLDKAATVTKGAVLTDVIVAFVHGEEADEINASKVETKLIKNIKWLSGKLNCTKIVLHSFAHLGESKCTPAFLKELFDRAQERLCNVGFEVEQTPFGYFLDISMAAPGKSLARVYKEF